MSSRLPPSLRLLFLSTPVGPLGSGLGGGVELTLGNIARIMQQRGHQVQIVAPQGSQVETLPVIQVPGSLQPTAQAQSYNDPLVLPTQSVLAQMWHYAHQVQADYDLLLNFAYDWLPFYLTPLFTRPIAHLVSMGSLTAAMDHIIGQIACQYPETVAVHSLTQAQTFPFFAQSPLRCLGNGFDLSQYQFCGTPGPWLAWVGRIAPEKGLEDAIAVAQATGIPLKILGARPDLAYWEKVCQGYPQAPIQYEGFLPTTKLQQVLRECRALLVTSRWVEAFGNVAVEALACGVPVIAYRRGGLTEIVQEGKTGWLVEPDSIVGLGEAIARLDTIDRSACRQQAEAEFSLAAMGDRVEQWLSKILNL